MKFAATKKKRIKHLQPKNCAPGVKNKTVNTWSCFPPKIILALRDQYNKKYSDKITSKNPKQIWRQLMTKMRKCKNELCWIRRLLNKQSQKKLKMHLFSPDQPESWKKDPNTWLSNFDIENVLLQYEAAYKEFDFIGPSFIDYNTKINNKCVTEELCNFNIKELLKKGKTKIGIVFNLDHHYQGGSHWVSMFVDLKEKFIFYFDSNSTPIPSSFQGLVDNIVNQGKQVSPTIDFDTYVTNTEHQLRDGECGMYSLYFIITLLTQEINGQKYPIKKLIDIFQNEHIKDSDVASFRKIYYN